MAGKLLGAFLIVVSCFCMGYRVSIREKLRLEELLFFKRFILKLMSILESKHSIFQEAFQEAIGEDKNSICLAILNSIQNNNSVKTAWKFSFEENIKDSYMNKEDFKRLTTLGEGFSSDDIKLQRQYVENVTFYIEESESLIKEKFEKDKKIYRSVSVSIGLFIVLLIL